MPANVVPWITKPAGLANASRVSIKPSLRNDPKTQKETALDIILWDMSQKECEAEIRHVLR